MGKILCEKHGESFIVQMSKTLHEKYINKEESSIVKLVFKINGIPDIINYFSVDEKMDNLLSISNVEEFEQAFLGFSGNPGACEKCFLEYIDELRVKIIEKIVKIG